MTFRTHSLLSLWIPRLLVGSALCALGFPWALGGCAAEGEGHCRSTFGDCLVDNTQSFDIDGIRVLHLRTPDEPAVMIRIGFDRRGVAQSDRESHAEGMLLRIIEASGSSKRDGDVSERLARLGATMWSNEGQDFSALSGKSPQEHWELLWEEMTLAMNEPWLDGAHLNWSAGHRRSSYSAKLDTPFEAARHLAWSLLYSGHRYGADAGSAHLIPGLTLQDLRKAAAGLRLRRRLCVVFLGDVDRVSVQEAVASAFQSYSPQQTDPPADLPAPPPARPADATVREFPSADRWHVYGMYHVPTPGDPEYASTLLASALLHDRLSLALRDRTGLAGYLLSGMLTLHSNANYLSFSATEPLRVLGIVDATLNELVDSPPTQEEIHAQKERLATQLHADNSTLQDRSWTLLRWQVLTGDSRGIDDLLDRLGTITPEDVSAMLAKYARGLQLAAAGSGEPLSRERLLPFGR